MMTASVTGANKGIGHEVARQLVTRGFHVFVGARNRDSGRVAADALAKNGGKATFLEIDVADNASVTTAAREFSKIADHLPGLLWTETAQSWKSANARDQHVRRSTGDARIRTLARKKQNAARFQCLERRRSVNWWCGRLGAGLLHLEDCAKRRYVATREGTTEICSEFCLPGLGADRHGRQKRNPLGRRRRGDDRLACHRCAAEPYRQILA
jgi:hypothetical protein